MKNIEKQKERALIPLEYIVKRIFWIRGKKVMIDRDLAELYGVETRTLNQAVQRNIDRFPEDFMFQLNKSESESFSRSQIVILKRGGNVKYLPYAFTEQGVAMLSSVLKSKRAVQVNIHIVRSFVQLREMLATHKDLAEKIEKMERKYDKQFKVVFEVMQKLLREEPKGPATMSTIGFRERSTNKE